MDYPKFIVSNQKEESICKQMVELSDEGVHSFFVWIY